MPGRRIGIIGAIGPRKGSALVEACAASAVRRQLELEFVVIGHTDRDDVLTRLGNVQILGRYRSTEELQLVAKSQLDLIWITSVTPETHLYTLSTALMTDLPIIAFGMGSIPERLQSVGNAVILDMGLINEPDQVTDALLECPLGREPRSRNFVTYASVLNDYYGLDLSPRPTQHSSKTI